MTKGRKMSGAELKGWATAEKVNEELRARFAAQCMRAGVSPAELAENNGFPAYLFLWANKNAKQTRRKISITQLAVAANCLNVPMSYFLEGMDQVVARP